VWLQVSRRTAFWPILLYHGPTLAPSWLFTGLLNRIYISGDTLMVDDLKAIPEHYKGQNVDLMLIHLGGTTIPSPSLPLLMVTMDAKQDIDLVKLICPDLTIPIHYE
jgi:L-ascorbate metabolism protein UlaG (beta-lactamase superfamily)